MFRTNQNISQTDTAKTPKSAVTVGASDTQIVPANGARVAVVICNDHASNILYLALGGTAVANQGIRVNAAGGTVFLPEFTGEIRGIATGAGTVVTFSEI